MAQVERVPLGTQVKGKNIVYLTVPADGSIRLEYMH